MPENTPITAEQETDMKETHWNMRPDKPKAVMLGKRLLAEFVCDAVNLEGIPFTLPEIQTLLDGITVGGYKLTDQQVALNQAAAWRQLFALVESNQFEVTAAMVCELHGIAAKEDARKWGKFRSGSAGYPAINLPAKRQLEFNRLMLAFYKSGNQKEMNLFLHSCLDERIINIMREGGEDT